MSRSGLVILVRLTILSLGLWSAAISTAWALDWRYEGRFLAGSEYLWDPPPGSNDFDHQVQLRNGLVGDLWSTETALLDFEFIFQSEYRSGAGEQAGFTEEWDFDVFRGWLRFEKDRVRLRAGRQAILFGPGQLFRPLGLFDTRNISGVIPQTDGVDGFRATYFTGPTSQIEGWAIPAQLNERVIWGLRGERQLGILETGLLFQYKPVTDLENLPSFNLELFQFGYHFKGTKTIGFWNEGRVDIEENKPGKPVRFDTVVGVDYTFNVGQGLHVLLEYFYRTQEPGFTIEDVKGERTLHELGMLIDQPVGIATVWRFFAFYDLRDRSFQLAPQIEYNVFDQVYLYLTARLGGSVEGDNRTGRLFRRTPRLNGSESRVGLTLVWFH
ncbi:hypothetical protein [Nitrospina watsonii]|uniref:Porin n=1 Tax=Nitrospina watsonii TaxID=1323948 RepID=A0ABN8W377_9BACT|nr:hypothetical protein [Nitrospina watsonii]CAI2718528.1 conserved protein of unknown function [Nitrospina watsonii]